MYASVFVHLLAFAGALCRPAAMLVVIVAGLRDRRPNGLRWRRCPPQDPSRYGCAASTKTTIANSAVPVVSFAPITEAHHAPAESAQHCYFQACNHLPR